MDIIDRVLSNKKNYYVCIRIWIHVQFDLYVYFCYKFQYALGCVIYMYIIWVYSWDNKSRSIIVAVFKKLSLFLLDPRSPLDCKICSWINSWIKLSFSRIFSDTDLIWFFRFSVGSAVDQFTADHHDSRNRLARQLQDKHQGTLHFAIVITSLENRSYNCFDSKYL